MLNDPYPGTIMFIGEPAAFWDWGGDYTWFFGMLIFQGCVWLWCEWKDEREGYFLRRLLGSEGYRD